MSRRRIPVNNRPPRANVRVNLDTLPDMSCPNCESIYFRQIVQIKHLSAIIAPNGKAQDITVAHMQCAACGWVVNKMEPGKSGMLLQKEVFP